MSPYSLHVASEVIDKFVLHGLQISHALQFNSTLIMLIHVKGKAVKLESIQCGNWTLAMVITRIVQRDCQRSNIWYFSAFFHKDETHMKQIGACIKRHTAWTMYLSDGPKTMQKNNYMLLSSILFVVEWGWYGIGLLMLNFLVFPHRFKMVMVWSRWKVCPGSLLR